MGYDDALYAGIKLLEIVASEDNKFSDIGAVEFKKQDIKKINNNHVKNLLSFDGIELILVSENFISVKKDNSLGWDKLKPTVISWINDYFEKNNKPILSKNLNEEKKEKTENENKDSVIQKINDVLDNKIRPAVARDGATRSPSASTQSFGR